MRCFIVGSFVALLMGCAAPMTKGSTCVVEPGYLANETTFTWRQFAAIDLVDSTGYVSPMMRKALEDTVKGELARKGFEFVERQDLDQWTDVEIALTLRVRREVASLTINESPCRDNDCWERIDSGAATRMEAFSVPGTSTRGRVGNDVPERAAATRSSMEVQTIGFLAADVYYMDEPIWRGWVERTLYPADRDAADSVIGESVPALFESFPP